MEETGERKPQRQKLPDVREGHTFKLVLGVEESVEEVVKRIRTEGQVPSPTKIKAFMTANVYEDGRLGEIFVTPDKEGTLLKGLLDGFATMTSIALQYGVPLEVVVKKFLHTRFGPQGMTNDAAVPMSNSVLDFMVRKLAIKFLSADQCVELGVVDHSTSDKTEHNDGQGKDDQDWKDRPFWADEEGFERQEGWEWQKARGTWSYVNRKAFAVTRGATT